MDAANCAWYRSAMTTRSKKAPLFVHASHRSGSTFVFHVLRRLAPLVCFNEPFNDQLGTELTKTTIANRTESWDTNHRFLDASAYQEYVPAWDAIMPRYRGGAGARGFLPVGGALPPDQLAYLSGFVDYARSRGKRLALCEVQSLGRVGALRDAFAGYHVTQIRDPFSQWGSLFRLVEGDRLWWFMAVPSLQTGLNGDHPLYRLLPEELRLPKLPWPDDDRWARWGSTVDYIAMMRSIEPSALERAFRRFLSTWILNHVAAIAYSDLVLDIDDLAEDRTYRDETTCVLADEIGVAPDFAAIANYSRYYEFEAFDMAATARGTAAPLREALRDGLLAGAVGALARQPPLVAVEEAAERVLHKLDSAIMRMTRSKRRCVGNLDWARIVRSGRLRWESRAARSLARRVDRIGRPLLRAVRSTFAR